MKTKALFDDPPQQDVETPATPLNTILVPVDGSECAPGVVRHAADLAARVGADVVLMHAYRVEGVEPGATISPDGAPTTAREHVRAGADRRLGGLLPVCGVRGVPARTVAIEGAPVEAILKAADEHGADLIVMGTHGRRGLQRVLLGSVAEAVLRRSEVPVLTVRSRRHDGCTAKDCATCTSHISAEARSVSAERDG